MTSTGPARWLTLPGIVLALALTAVLIACGSDEPPVSPATEATTSTLMPEDASTGTAATSAPMPGSEPTAAPRPTATTAPLLTIGPTSAATDLDALVALYNATDGPNWKDNENWLSDAPLRQWYGVKTNDDGRVKELRLYTNELSGRIPPELGSLANLEELWLSNNYLGGGEIPPELGSLANLEVLDLHANGLIGEIPPELGSLANLEVLDLHANGLIGEIPPELGNLANLKKLFLSFNWFLSGEIPPELGSLRVGELRLDGNPLSGCAPASLERIRSKVDLPDTVYGYCR